MILLIMQLYQMNASFKKGSLSVLFLIFISFGPLSIYTWAQEPQKQLEVKVCPYPGRDPVMWDGVYAASNGKVYSALIDEGAGAHFYEYDPATNKNTFLYDIAEFAGARGKGARSPGKVHNKPVEDNEGYIYFVPMNNGSGPTNIDFLSWEGGMWARYDPKTQELENLGQVDEHIGCYPITIDKKRKRLFGLGFNGYLYRFDIEKRKTKKKPGK